MKLNLGRRIVLFVHWLASLVLLAILVVPEYVGYALSGITTLIPQEYMRYVMIALVVVYLLLSLSVLCMIFKRSGQKRSERGFITVDSADTGKVRIAISAIEQMVKQAAHTVDGIADMKIAISNSDDAIAIQVNVNMISGSHVPTVTLNMQRAIRQFVEMNCGVAVRSVSVSIQSVTNPGDGSRKGKRFEAKPAAPAQEWTAPVEQPAESVPAPALVEEPVYEPVITEPECISEPSVEEPEITVESCEEITETIEINNEEEKEN